MVDRANNNKQHCFTYAFIQVTNNRTIIFSELSNLLIVQVHDEYPL